MHFVISFFGGGGHRRERKGPDLRIVIPAKLEDIYNGKEIEVKRIYLRVLMKKLCFLWNTMVLVL